MIDGAVAKDGLGWLLIGVAVMLIGGLAAIAGAGWGSAVLVVGLVLVVVALLALGYEFIRRD